MLTRLIVSNSLRLMDYSPLASSVHGILQARILAWVATSSSRGIFRTQGLNPHLLHHLHSQANSLSLIQLGSPLNQLLSLGGSQFPSSTQSIWTQNCRSTHAWVGIFSGSINTEWVAGVCGLRQHRCTGHLMWADAGGSVAGMARTPAMVLAETSVHWQAPGQ